MYVCLCYGITSHMVAECVAKGACSSKEVALACGAGSECGRCRRTVRAIIAVEQNCPPDPGPVAPPCATLAPTPQRPV
ncbi:MAG TPA: (2Fe-2S)-binding protein [Aldersonia sp.]